MGDTYYIICRRHTCSNPKHERRFTFLAYDPEVVRLLPVCVQEQLPAFLTRKWALDKTLHRLVRLVPSAESAAALGAQRLTAPCGWQVLDMQARGVPVSRVAAALKEQDYMTYFHLAAAFYSQLAEEEVVAARMPGGQPVPPHQQFPDFKCSYNWTLSETYLG
jgi:hypothetical protein